MTPKRTRIIALILVGVLSTPLSYLSNWIMHFFVWATQWIGTLVQMVM